MNTSRITFNSAATSNYKICNNTFKIEGSLILQCLTNQEETFLKKIKDNKTSAGQAKDFGDSQLWTGTMHTVNTVNFKINFISSLTQKLPSLNRV
jgi:hypothetical protein